MRLHACFAAGVSIPDRAPTVHRAGSLVATVACVFGATACASPPPTAIRIAPHRPPATTTTTTTVATEQAGWTTISRTSTGIAVDTQTLTQLDGSSMTLVRFLAGHVTFNLHIGSLEPPTGNAAIGPDSGPMISSAEAPSVLACFNGGFKVHDHPGGIVTWGQHLTAVEPGLGTFVTDAAGHATVGVWGYGMPNLQNPALNVRQNLQPLVTQGQINPKVDNVLAWGATFGGGKRVARSGLGEDTFGNIIYVASMSTVPADLARVLVAVGAINAMQLDINPATLQMATAAWPGGPLSAQIPGQQHPSNRCQIGSTRDFVVALAAPATAPAAPAAPAVPPTVASTPVTRSAGSTIASGGASGA